MNQNIEFTVQSDTKTPTWVSFQNFPCLPSVFLYKSGCWELPTKFFCFILNSHERRHHEKSNIFFILHFKKRTEVKQREPVSLTSPNILIKTLHNFILKLFTDHIINNVTRKDPKLTFHKSKNTVSVWSKVSREYIAININK